jgi:hypothetical protein
MEITSHAANIGEREQQQGETRFTAKVFPVYTRTFGFITKVPLHAL